MHALSNSAGPYRALACIRHRGKHCVGILGSHDASFLAPCPSCCLAGSVFMTVGDLHDWYRRLFGNPEQLGLTPGE